MSETAQELVDRMAAAGEWPEADLMQAIVDRGEEAVGPLLDLIRQHPHGWPAEAPSYHALGLLTHLPRSEAVLAVLLDLFRHYDNEMLELLSDVLVPYGLPILEPLLAVVRARNLPEDARSVAGGIALHLAHADAGQFERVKAILREELAYLLGRAKEVDNNEREMASSLIAGLAYAADPEAQPLIAAALEADLSTMLSEEDVDTCYALGTRVEEELAENWLAEYRRSYNAHQAYEAEQRAAEASACTVRASGAREIHEGAGFSIAVADALLRFATTEDRPQRPVLVRQRQEIQELPPPHGSEVNMHLIKRWSLLLSLLALLTASGCGPAPAPRRTIGLSLLTLTNPFFKEIADTMTAEAATHGYDVLVVSGEFDVARQDKQVKDFLVKRVNAIVLCPCDSRAIGPVIQEANFAGVPVFTVDIGCLAPEAQVVTHVATDNYSGGKQAGQAMIEALGDGGGKVGILDLKTVESCQLRVKGFKEVIDAHNRRPGVGKIVIVAELNGGGARDQGYKAAEDLLQAHADLAGIFAINDPSALVARAVLEKAGRAGRIKIVGFDGQPEGKLAIKEGKLYADPIQYPDRIGREAARIIARYFDGDEVPPEMLIPTGLYRQADGVKDPALK